MITFLFIVLVLLLAVVQTSFLPHFELLGSVPNLMLVFVISWCILKNYKNGLLGAVLGGFFLDLFSSIFFGLNMISLLVVMISVYLIVTNFVDVNNVYTRMGVISIATVFYYLFILLVFFILEFFDLELLDYLKPLWQKIIGGIVLNVVLMFLFYRVVNFFQDFSIKYNDKVKAKT